MVRATAKPKSVRAHRERNLRVRITELCGNKLEFKELLKDIFTRGYPGLRVHVNAIGCLQQASRTYAGDIAFQEVYRRTMQMSLPDDEELGPVGGTQDLADELAEAEADEADEADDEADEAEDEADDEAEADEADLD